MAEDRGEVRSIAWHEVLPGLRLFSALRIGLSFQALALAALALVFTSAGWQVCGKLFDGTEDAELRQVIAVMNAWPWHDVASVPMLDELDTIDTLREKNPLVVAWNAISDPFQSLFANGISATHFVYILVCALWSLLVWSFFGGALTRMAAVRIAAEENASLGHIVGFARRRLGSYFVAPLFPILGAFLAAGILAVVGLVMRSDVGLAATGALWFVALFFGFLMAFLLIGLFFCWPLMWAAISAEGTDAFGALSHSYSYTYQRPLHYLMYALLAALIGFLGWYLVTVFALYLVTLTMWGVSWGAGNERIREITTGTGFGDVGNAGLAMMHFWNGCVVMLAAAFVYSYFWSAVTVIYFLLRRLVDATEMDELFTPEERALHGLPPLKTGPDGVPQVADVAAAENTAE